MGNQEYNEEHIHTVPDEINVSSKYLQKIESHRNVYSFNTNNFDTISRNDQIEEHFENHINNGMNISSIDQIEASGNIRSISSTSNFDSITSRPKSILEAKDMI